MSDKVNHRRKNRKKVISNLKNGHVPKGRHNNLDKSMMSWGKISLLSDRLIGAGISNDFSNGHRGMARAVKGAKKFVRSRTRFHENAHTRKHLLDYEDG